MSAERVHVFLLLRRGGKPERIVVWDTQDITLGRAPENDIVVEDPEMSRTQAGFRRDGEAHLIDNLSTANPTYVNGESVTTHTLSNKDAVRIGDTELFFYRVTQNPVTLNIKTEYASQLKGFGPQGAGDGESTILGLMEEAPVGDDDFEVRPGGDFQHDMAGIEQPSQPRNLDAELAEDGIGDLDMPAQPAVQEPWSLDEGADGGSTLSLHLEIEGLSAEHRSMLAALLGKVIQLPTMRVRVKGADLG